MKWKNRDNLHYTFNSIDGYDKVFNFVISGREPGKTTTGLLDKAYLSYTKGKPYMFLKRRIVDVTKFYIESCNDIFNKFLPDDAQMTFKYNTGDLKNGICKVYDDKDNLVYVAVGLSAPLSRLKSLMLRNIGGIIFDEFICNLNVGEKYLTGEWFKFKEFYSTFQRESENSLKCYFLGNPYSMFNPYFMGLGIDTTQLKLGKIYSQDNYAVELYMMTPELQAYILKHNPLYEFDDEYKRYAFFGEPVNDSIIKIIKNQPAYFRLFRLFVVESKMIAVYENTNAENNPDLDYWICRTENQSVRREVYCTDINELSQNRIAMSIHDIRVNQDLANAMRKRLIGFKDISSYYLFLNIYNFL